MPIHIKMTPHHSHHLHSQHLSLPRLFTPDLKLIRFTNNPFLNSLSGSLWTAITNCLTRSLGQDLLCFSFFAYIFYFVVTCAVLDKADWPHSACQHFSPR